jgi:hypothetical protein
MDGSRWAAEKCLIGYKQILDTRSTSAVSFGAVHLNFFFLLSLLTSKLQGHDFVERFDSWASCIHFLSSEF